MTSLAAQAVGAWVAGLTLPDVPANIRAIARSCLVDTVGVALAGSAEPAATLVRAHVLTTYRDGPATILGTAERRSAVGAALANGTAAHVLDFDDNNYAGGVHGSAVVAPAVLAACEAANASGADLLSAFIAGVEAEYAVGMATTLSIYHKGWWTTGVLGAIGAAAGAARALGLNAAQTTCAIGLAAAGTGGIKACFGTQGKPILAGRAAANGLEAAMLAAKGATGPAGVFEATNGFAQLFNDGRFEADAVAALGRSWRLETPGIDVKRYPICLSGQAAADGTREILDEHRLAVSAIERIDCEVPPLVASNLKYRLPTSAPEAQFSLNFAVACMALFGDITLAHLERAVIEDERLRQLMARIDMTASKTWNDDPVRARDCPEGAIVRVRTTDGRTFERYCGNARGTVARPLSEAEIDAKFRACATRRIPAAKADALLRRLRTVDTVERARGIFVGL